MHTYCVSVCICVQHCNYAIRFIVLLWGNVVFFFQKIRQKETKTQIYIYDNLCNSLNAQLVHGNESVANH